MQSTSIAARTQAWDALTRILSTRCVFDEAVHPHAPERAYLRMLLLATLRHLGQIDALIRPHLQRPLPAKHRAVMDALRLGAAQLLVLQTAPHAAVNETVAMVKASKHAALAGLVNAVLKQLQGPLPDCRHNLPPLFEQRWKAQYGKAVADAVCRVAAERPPLDLHSAASFAEGARLDENIWRMNAPYPPVSELPGYAEGAFFVQDIAASLPVRLLGDVRGLRVLDVGAAPGGKTMQLAQGGAQVTALDKSAIRMERLRENLQRMRLQAQVEVADAMEYAPSQSFDAVVLDAPCSATGTWRRHPEVVHITTVEDIAELAATQRALLARAWGWVKPGGRLVYCVCSLESEEGEGQREWFLREHADAILQRPAADLLGLQPDGSLRTTPAMLAEQGGMDGFFAAMFSKSDK